MVLRAGKALTCRGVRRGPLVLITSFFLFIEGQLIYSVVPVSAVQQSDSVIHRQTFFFFIFFPADYFLRELPLPPTISSALSVTLPAVLSGDSEASAVGLCSPASHTRVTWAVK